MIPVRLSIRRVLRLAAMGFVAAAVTAVLANGHGSAAARQTPAPAPVAPELFAAMHWRLVGPYRSGNVYAVAGVPDDPTVYYLGLPEGGVWKTTDGGTVWKPIFDQEAVPAIGAVAVADSDPKVVYVGTGDPTSWSFTPGKGVFKSTDAGQSWQHIGLDDTQNIPALLVDPHNPNLVLVGALGPRGGRGAPPPPAAGAEAGTRGVFRSTDGGATWQPTFTAAGVTDMAWDYNDPRIVYIVVQRAGGFGRGAAAPAAGSEPVIYKSSDEGATWQPAGATGLPPGLRSANIAVAAGTHGRRVYIISGGLPGGRASGVYRSDDGGQTWQLGTEEIGSAGGRIYVDPQNPDVVYLMGTSMYRSTDGAHTFNSFKGSPGGDDFRDLWIDPHNSRRMLAGVDQGPTITVDGGRTWTPWYNLPNGQFYDVFTDNQDPYWIYGAQQDSGTAAVVSRSDYGSITDRDWYPVGGFEAGYIAVDPLDPRWVYTQGWYHVLRRFDRKTWQVIVVYTPTPEDRFGSMPPTVFSPTNPHRLYLGAQYVLASDDGGRIWYKLGGDLTQRPASPESAAAGGAAANGRGGAGRGAAAGRGPAGGRGGTIDSLAPSPINGQVLWAGTSNGLIQLSRDGGQSWTNVSPPDLSARSAVNHIDAGHHSTGTAYAAVEEAGSNAPLLYRTGDFGQSWQKIVNGLPDDYKTRVVREDPQDPNLLYAGTEFGAYVSFDRGDLWQPLQLNLPHTVVSDMTVHGDDLVISTYGRSLWVLDDVTPLRQARAAAAAGTAYLYQPETAERIRWSENQDTPLPPEVPAGQNPPEGAIIDYYLPTAATGAVTLDISDSAGHLVRQYSNTPPPPDNSPPNVPEYWFRPPVVLATTPGMHRLAWDLRFPTPKALTYSYYGNMLDYTEYTLTWHAIIGNTPRVQPVGPIAIPGTYTLKLDVDGHATTRSLTLRNDPRSPATQADLVAQLALEQRVVAGLSASYDAYDQIDALRRVVAADESAAAGNAALAEPLQKLDDQIAPLASGTADHGFGVANRDLARRLQDLDFGDFAPDQSLIASVNYSCGQIGAAATELQTIEQQTVPALNRQLASAHLTPLPEATVQTGPPCGH